MSTISDEAVAWFFMGEGCATFVCNRRKESKGLMSALGYRLTPRIAITNTDTEILEPIKEWLKTKEIHFITSVQKYRNQYLPLTIIRIEQFKEAQKFLKIVLPHLHGKKKLVCELMLECLSKYGGRGNWSEIMRDKIIRGEHGRIVGVNWDFDEERRRFLNIMRYRDKIATLNGGYKAKYNYQFFANLWGMSSG